MRLKAIVVLAGTLGAGEELVEDARLRSRQRPGDVASLGHDAAQCRAALEHVLDLGRIDAGVVVRRLLQLVVRDRQLEAVAEDLQLVHRELLGLVRDVAALDAGAERPALDRLGEDHGRGAGVRNRSRVGRVHLPVVVTATP